MKIDARPSYHLITLPLPAGVLFVVVVGACLVCGRRRWASERTTPHHGSSTCKDTGRRCPTHTSASRGSTLLSRRGHGTGSVRRSGESLRWTRRGTLCTEVRADLAAVVSLPVLFLRGWRAFWRIGRVVCYSMCVRLVCKVSHGHGT